MVKSVQDVLLRLMLRNYHSWFNAKHQSRIKSTSTGNRASVNHSQTSPRKYMNPSSSPSSSFSSFPSLPHFLPVRANTPLLDIDFPLLPLANSDTTLLDADNSDTLVNDSESCIALDPSEGLELAVDASSNGGVRGRRIRQCRVCRHVRRR